MAVYGVGAYYDGIGDVSGKFIAHNIIGAGWDISEAPELHDYFKTLKVGDMVYIKAAFGGNDITVKAIGIICNYDIVHIPLLVSIGRNVKWLSTERFVIPRPGEKNNVRSNTVYEEFHPDVLTQLMSRIKTP